ncbi:MAG: TetR family transcriptional regulator, partial [Bacteroides sp.]
MIYTRLDAVKEVVYRNGTLRAVFFRDIWRVEKVRKKFDTKEMILFKGVLQEGKEKGVFRIDDVDMTAALVHYCVKGIEVPYIRGHIGSNLDMETRKKYVANIVFGALHRIDH